MKELKLPSGAVLKISNTPFEVSKKLFQAVLAELKNVKMNPETSMVAMVKEISYIAFASPSVEGPLSDCFKYCIYNDLKIDRDTFEKEEARKDYCTVCTEVIEKNISPFTSGLFVESSRLLAIVLGSQK